MWMPIYWLCLHACVQTHVSHILWVCSLNHTTLQLIGNTRSASNPMDKGACYFINSEIQTWPPSTIKSNFIKFLIRIIYEMHARVHHVTGTTETKLREQSQMVRWKNSSRGKAFCYAQAMWKLLLWTTASLFYDSVALLITQHDEMVFHSVHPCCA